LIQTGVEDMDIMIRKAQICDIPSIIKMNAAFNGVVSTIDWVTESLENSESLEKLENNEREIVFVAVHNSTAIGFICGQLYKSICYPNIRQAEMTELFICEEYRGNGIAARLIKELESEFIKNNVNEIVLKTGRENVIARKIYEKCGYEDYEEVVYCKEF
jgi:ribosomal protein S18 acetylase RimI-like enzyme